MSIMVQYANAGQKATPRYGTKTRGIHKMPFTIELNHGNSSIKIDLADVYRACFANETVSLEDISKAIRYMFRKVEAEKADFWESQTFSLFQRKDIWSLLSILETSAPELFAYSIDKKLLSQQLSSIMNKPIDVSEVGTYPIEIICPDEETYLRLRDRIKTIKHHTIEFSGALFNTREVTIAPFAYELLANEVKGKYDSLTDEEKMVPISLPTKEEFAMALDLETDQIIKVSGDLNILTLTFLDAVIAKNVKKAIGLQDKKYGYPVTSRLDNSNEVKVSYFVEDFIDAVNKMVQGESSKSHLECN